MKISEEIKYKLQDIGQWILNAFLIVGFILVLGVMKADGFHTGLFTTGIILIVIPLIVLFTIISEGPNEEQVRIDKLKKYGLRIEVDLSKCKLTKGKPRWNSNKGVVLDSTGNEIEVVYEDVKDNHLRLIYTFEHNNTHTYFISEPILQDKDIASMIISNKKLTQILIDKKNPNNYYFDLEFMK